MGLIKAALGSAGGVLADPWKEFFVCDALPKDVVIPETPIGMRMDAYLQEKGL